MYRISCEFKKSKEEGKCQESIQLSISHLTQDILWESDKSKRKPHLQKRLEISSQGHRRVFKSGPTEEPSSAEGTRGVSFHPLVRGFGSLTRENI